jgi:hypothetical protein
VIHECMNTGWPPAAPVTWHAPTHLPATLHGAHQEVGPGAVTRLATTMTCSLAAQA